MQARIEEQIYRIRRMWPDFDRDPSFYDAKKHLRKRLRSFLGKNCVVIMEPRSVRVYYGHDTVVI